ncbi:MAG: hypothetical protein K2F65_06350 [Eubacterium sp.]|nr:hypothetical protein [Eubacterium sp.]
MDRSLLIILGVLSLIFLITIINIVKQTKSKNKEDTNYFPQNDISKPQKLVDNISESTSTNQENKKADKNIHNKIIKEVCKEILFPLGVFQKGNSKTFLDDNGYFFTAVEFQPSTWSRGSYLNIGIYFFWHNTDYITYDMYLGNRLSRVEDFVEYENDEQFRNEMTRFANRAKEQILFFRQLRDLDIAKKWILNFGEESDKTYEKAMICVLTDDLNLAKKHYKKYMETESFKYRKEIGEHIPYSLEELTKNSVISNIKNTRAFWHSKSSMKKMPVSSEYDME